MSDQASVKLHKWWCGENTPVQKLPHFVKDLVCQSPFLAEKWRATCESCIAMKRITRIDWHHQHCGSAFKKSFRAFTQFSGVKIIAALTFLSLVTLLAGRTTETNLFTPSFLLRRRKNTFCTKVSNNDRNCQTKPQMTRSLSRAVALNTFYPGRKDVSLLRP